MENRVIHWAVARLEDRVKQGADAAEIANFVVSISKLIETILSPIIGQKSIDSLYQRSLVLAVPVYPWLKNVYGGIESPMDFAALKTMIAQQSSADAAAGGGAFLHSFHEMLIQLIGSKLTEILLRPVWKNYSSGPPAQDTSP